jgi:chorismate mutase
MAIDLNDLRVRLDQITEQIISGLKDRSRFPFNECVFTEEFSDRLTWFEYRLKKEQDLDSEFGRYQFDDQYPILFSKHQLVKPKKQREIPPSDVKPVPVNIGDKLIQFYIKMLIDLCKDGEDRSTYGETARCDANNVLLYQERVDGIGRHVAQSKIDQNPGILELETDEEIRNVLVIPWRERRVIRKGVRIARKYELCQPRLPTRLYRLIVGSDTDARYVSPEFVQKFFRGLIDLTVEAEIEYVKKVREARE